MNTSSEALASPVLTGGRLTLLLQGKPRSGAIRFARAPDRKRRDEMDGVGQLESLNALARPFAQVVFAQPRIAANDHQVQAFAQPLVGHAEGERRGYGLVPGEQILDLQWADLVACPCSKSENYRDGS